MSGKSRREEENTSVMMTIFALISIRYVYERIHNMKKRVESNMQASIKEYKAATVCATSLMSSTRPLARCEFSRQWPALFTQMIRSPVTGASLCPVVLAQTPFLGLHIAS